MTKYRIIDDGEEITVITDDGGVACIRFLDNEDYITTIDYYGTRLTRDMIDNGDIWEELGEGKMYYDDFTTPYTNPEHVQTALDWLVVGETEFVLDEDIWKGC